MVRFARATGEVQMRHFEDKIAVLRSREFDALITGGGACGLDLAISALVLAFLRTM